MTKFVIQKFVYTGKPISKTALFVQVFNAPDGSPATLWSDRDGNTELFNHETTATNGFFRVYVDPGLYNIRVFDGDENESWYYYIEAGQFHSESGKKYAIQYQVYGGSPLNPASITAEVWDASDDSAASLWNDFDGSDARADNTVAASNGRFLVFTDPGRYNVRVYDSKGNESWYYDIEVGEWHSEAMHVLQYPIFDGDPASPALDNVTVYVHDVLADDAAPVYTDIDGASSLANPFSAAGEFRCYVPDGLYNIEIYQSGSVEPLFDLRHVLAGLHRPVIANKAAYAFLVDHTGPNDIAYTEDGATWQLTTGDSTIDGVNNVVELVACPDFGTLVCITMRVSSGLIRVFVTTDGEEWTEEDSGTINGGDTIYPSSLCAAYSPTLQRLLVLSTKSNSPTATIVAWSDDGGYTWSRDNSTDPFRSFSPGSVDWSSHYGYFYRCVDGPNPSASLQISRSSTGLAGSWTTVGESTADEDYYAILCIDEIEKVIAVGAVSAGGGNFTGIISISNTSGVFPSSTATIGGSGTITGGNFRFSDIAYSPELDVIVIVSTTSSPINTVVYSTDQGATWTAVDPGFGSSGFHRVVWSSSLGLFIAGGDDSDDAWGYSADGINWTQVDLTGDMHTATGLALISGDDVTFYLGG